MQDNEPPRNPEPLAGFEPALREEMSRIGPIWATNVKEHIATVWKWFGPLVASAVEPGVQVEGDVAYGDHPRQVLDVYYPPHGTAGPRPILLFVHGGAFVRGNKDNGLGGYGNLCRWFARHGVVAINVEYRLAPESRFPGATDDVAAAVAWAHANAERLGGDSGQIVLMGHSAGGCHVASYAYDPHVGYQGRHLAGLVLVSARLRGDVSERNPNREPVKAYFGDDVENLEFKSPVSYGDKSALPTFIAIAEFENPLLDAYGAELAAKRLLAGLSTRFVQLTGHNHSSIIAHFNSGEDILGDEILRFMARDCGIRLPPT